MAVSLTHIDVPGVRLGIYAKERQQAQPVVAHLRLGLDVSEVLHHDDITATANYAALIQTAQDVCHSRHFDLLESLVAALVHQLLGQHPKLMWADVEVEKTQAPVPARVAARWARCRGCLRPNGAFPSGRPPS
jgi:dihydroneopterin aldolase